MRRAAYLLVLALAATAVAKWARPVSAPIARLLDNAEAAAKKDPKSASAHYLVGRLRSLAYASDAKMVEVYDPDQNPQFPAYAGVQVPYSRPQDALTPSARAHLIASIGHYAKAVEFDPKNGLYWLGYGWMVEQGSRWTSALPKEATGFPKGSWIDAAASAYKQAYAASKEKDAASEHRMAYADGQISVEAIDNLRRLSGSGKIKLDSAFAAEMRKHEALMAKKPMMITPIVFPLRSGTPLAGIDNPKARVKFDLDGSGTARRWSWITPNAAFLVWHPLNDGKVDSGREMFGNATFWMFFRDGYEALASLDDDRDGVLRGRELRFIAAWRDANANGISEPGEVRPLDRYGIVGIRCAPEGKKGAVWFNPNGLLLARGGSLPTYDWVARGR